jgi:hypothetical protein
MFEYMPLYLTGLKKSTRTGLASQEWLTKSIVGSISSQPNCLSTVFENLGEQKIVASCILKY